MRIFLFGSLHRIETFFDFFFVSNIFRIPSVSLSLSLSLLKYLLRILLATVYTCASRVPFVRPVPTFFEIFYSIENGILIPSPLPRIVSIQVGEVSASYFNATVLRVIQLYLFAPSRVERNEETWRQLGWIDGLVETVVWSKTGAKEGCARA